MHKAQFAVSRAMSAQGKASFAERPNVRFTNEIRLPKASVARKKKGRSELMCLKHIRHSHRAFVSVVNGKYDVTVWQRRFRTQLGFKSFEVIRSEEHTSEL